MQKEPMTSDGYDRLTTELSDMKLVQRPKIIIAIEEARQLGDLKENAEYHAAKEDQANINKRIAEMEDMVTKAVVIDPSTLAHDKVSFGSTVTIIDTKTDEEITYTLGSFLDSNPDAGIISFNSPLAKQLLGKEEGDEFTARLPGGAREFEVESISYKAF
ncbi:MAG: transcription elongation factor GreA [Arcobacteraceae bacterium]|nr:transcription elongation factor GreA [Arcobacteraceae bacterium]